MMNLAKAAMNILETLGPEYSELGKTPRKEVLGTQSSLRKILEMPTDSNSICAPERSATLLSTL